MSISYLLTEIQWKLIKEEGLRKMNACARASPVELLESPNGILLQRHSMEIFQPPKDWDFRRKISDKITYSKEGSNLPRSFDNSFVVKSNNTPSGTTLMIQRRRRSKWVLQRQQLGKIRNVKLKYRVLNIYIVRSLWQVGLDLISPICVPFRFVFLMFYGLRLDTFCFFN